MSVRGRVLVGSVAGALLATSMVAVVGTSSAAQPDPGVAVTVMTGPPASATSAGSQLFGSQVLVLSNGNYVVDDQGWDEGTVADVGAVHLYNGETDTIISTLVGGSLGDRIGSGGFVEVGTSNVVISSPGWSSSSTDTVGAMTWMNGTTGLSGVVGPGNSIIGAEQFQFNQAAVTPLENGNYIVTSSIVDGTETTLWITWGDGGGGSAGVVDDDNSFSNVGGPFIKPKALANGNYVVLHNDVAAGFLIWGDGTTGDPGDSTVLNGGGGAAVAPFPEHFIELTNGDVVVATPDWKSGRGAVTVVDGDSGFQGRILQSNSLVGWRVADDDGTGGDRVGSGGVYALTDGDFVIHSPLTMNAARDRSAALTRIDGTAPPTGRLTVQPSAYGATVDRPEYRSVVPLTNGNFVFTDPRWDADDAVDVGLVRLFADDVTGQITAQNSLIGSIAEDQIGSRGVVALTDGDYAVLSPEWNNPPAGLQVGAVTWRDGETLETAVVSPENSLVGSNFQDRVGSNGVVALDNGAAVVASPSWKRDSSSLANGAVTWVGGSSPVVGPVSEDNSLYGSSRNDQVGDGRAVVLDNGDYVVLSNVWNDGRGAATLGSGASGIAGSVSAENSFVGAAGSSFVGSGSAESVDATRFIIWSPALDGGAVTLSTPGHRFGVVSSANSAINEGSIFAPDAALTSGGAVAIPTASNRVILLRDIDDVPPVPVTTTPPTTTPPSTVPPITAPPTTPPTTVPPPVTAPPVTAPPNTVPPITAPPVTTPPTTGTTVPDVVSPAPVDAASDLVAVAPARLFDSRANGDTTDGDALGGGLVRADEVVRIEIAGRGGVDADATAAELNLTAIRPQGAGFATLYPCTSEVPVASTLNFAAGVTIANSLTVPLTSSGDVCISASAASNFVVDVIAFVPDGSKLVTDTPDRFLDTRNGNRADAGDVIEVDVAGRGEVPDGAVAAVVNLTAVRPSAAGFATLYPCTNSVPNASLLNYASGQKVANGALVPLSDDGTLCLYTSQASDLILDVAGYVTDGSEIETFTPARILDTRSGPSARTVDGESLGEGRVRSFVEVDVAGRGGVDDDATTAVLNVTVVGAQSAGFVTLYPCNSAAPNASILNFVAGANLANATVAKLSASGTVCISSSSDVHVLLDAAGSIKG